MAWLTILILQLSHSASSFFNMAPSCTDRHSQHIMRSPSRITKIPQRTTICLSHNTTDASPETTSSTLIQDPRLLAVDVVSIALASQLLGLADVLNDPTFWQQGGWFQPISPADSTSTLPTLVQRDSILTICWVLSALGWKGYNDGGEEELETSVRIGVSFIVLRLALRLAMSFVDLADFDVWDSIRQCYFAIILVGSFRFLYSQYIR